MMIFRNKLFLSLSLAAAAATLPAAALAQTMTVGAKVADTAGGAVGTIIKVDGANVILKTDKHEVQLPAASFTAVEDGYIMAMTQAEVNAAVDQTLAQAAQAMTVGALVKDTAGGTVGTIEAIDDQYVTVKLSKSAVKLPRTAFAPTPTGPVIGMTAAELEAQVAAAASAGAPTEAVTQ
jgi:preprotein translocase subunit YajC